MKIVVCWEHSHEKGFADRLAGIVRTVMQRAAPNVTVSTSSLVDHDAFSPYRNSAEVLAAEAQRLLDAQEAALGEHTDFEVLGHIGGAPVVQTIKGWDGRTIRAVAAAAGGAGYGAGGGGGAAISTGGGSGGGSGPKYYSIADPIADLNAIRSAPNPMLPDLVAPWTDEYQAVQQGYSYQEHFDHGKKGGS